MPTIGVINTTLLKVYKTDGTAIAEQTGASISFSHDLRETSSKDGGGYAKFLEGMRGAEVSCEGLYAYDHAFGADALFDSYTNRSTLNIMFTTNATGDKKYTATVYLTKLDLNSSGQEDNATYSASFKVTGAITKATV